MASEVYDFSKEYDLNARMHEWYGPEMLFGLTYEFLSEGEDILDLGIGSGLSSFPYYLCGLNVTGVDNSPDMLLVCEQKKFASQLVFHDLNDPLPFENEQFHHVTSCGVFHYFEKPEFIINEAARVLKSRGSFSFTVIDADQNINLDDAYIFGSLLGDRVYKHKSSDILKTTSKLNLELKKSTYFLGVNTNNSLVFFRAFVFLKN